jgi:putative PIN family toxin of toxin-antitoxin system
VRAVIDNNLIISGLLWSGAPFRLLDAVRNGRLELVLSPDLYLELEDVLNRDKFSSRIAKRGLSPRALLSSVSAVAEMVFPEHLPLPPSLRDPDDLAVLESAVAGRADVIVTGDQDLLTMGSFQNVPIVDVQTVLQMLGIAQG